VRRAAAVAALATLLLTAACGGSSGSGKAAGTTPAKPGAAVAIPLLSFTPENVTISPGQTVTWTNGNDISHVLVQGSYAVDSKTGLRTSE